MGFMYDTLPADHSCIRLLTLLPGSATIGKGDPLICLLTTHFWDPKSGRIHYTHAADSEKPELREASGGGSLAWRRYAISKQASYVRLFFVNYYR